MAVTQESVLFRLINEGGRIKKSEIASHFRDLECVDPAERQRNRELFKTFVNSVATVRELDGVRYVVLRKTYRHLLKGAERPDQGEIQPTGEQRSPPEPLREAGSRTVDEEADEESSGPPELLSPVEQALLRSKLSALPPRGIQQDETGVDQEHAALPLRLPPRASRASVSEPEPDPPERSARASPRSQRRLPLAESKSARAPEDPGEARAPSSAVPLEEAEHQWLVKCAAGHWGQVYGLLLRDSHLAEKRDFMSGFTAVHWAAKWGNGAMLVKIMDLAKEGGVQIDINAKTHGGYTPLHIAALHNQEYMVAMLVGEYGADPAVRDNSGKRPRHYLGQGASASIREMLGRPKNPEAPENPHNEREEPDLSRGRHSISRLFQPHAAAQKKKPKQRTRLRSLSEEGRPDGAAWRSRTASDACV